MTHEAVKALREEADYQEENFYRYHVANTLREAASLIERLAGDAERYRSIRLKAWLDSCVDDLVVNTPQAKEGEFNDGHDAMIDAEYPSSISSLGAKCECSTFSTGNGYCPVHGHIATR